MGTGDPRLKCYRICPVNFLKFFHPIPIEIVKQTESAINCLSREVQLSETTLWINLLCQIL